MLQGYKHPHPQNNFKHLQLKVILTFTLYVLYLHLDITELSCFYKERLNNLYPSAAWRNLNNALLSRLATVTLNWLFRCEGNIEYIE
jgi:hypothetical protein